MHPKQKNQARPRESVGPEPPQLRARVPGGGAARKQAGGLIGDDPRGRVLAGG